MFYFLRFLICTSSISIEPPFKIGESFQSQIEIRPKGPLSNIYTSDGETQLCHRDNEFIECKDGGEELFKIKHLSESDFQVQSPCKSNNDEYCSIGKTYTIKGSPRKIRKKVTFNPFSNSFNRESNMVSIEKRLGSQFNKSDDINKIKHIGQGDKKSDLDINLFDIKDSKSKPEDEKDSTPRKSLIERIKLKSKLLPKKRDPLLDTSLKDSSLLDSPLKDTSLKDSPLLGSPLKDNTLKENPLIDSPLKESSLLNSPLKENNVLSSSIKESSLLDSQLKESSLLNSPLKESSLLDSPLKESSLLKNSLKESPLIDSPVKESPLINSPVKESPLISSPVKESPLINSPVKESPLISTPVKESSLLDSQLLNTPLKDTQLLNTPLKESQLINNPPLLDRDIRNKDYDHIYSFPTPIQNPGYATPFTNPNLISHDTLSSISQSYASNLIPPQTCKDKITATINSDIRDFSTGTLNFYMSLLKKTNPELDLKLSNGDILQLSNLQRQYSNRIYEDMVKVGVFKELNKYIGGPTRIEKNLYKFPVPNNENIMPTTQMKRDKLIDKVSETINHAKESIHHKKKRKHKKRINHLIKEKEKDIDDSIIDKIKNMFTKEHGNVIDSGIVSQSMRTPLETIFV